MFTGLVEAIGTVVLLERSGGAARLMLRAPGLAGVEAGDSVSVDGACLTVTAADGEDLAFDVVGSTLDRTTIGGYAEGRSVNLETAVAAGEPFGGHIVQGHVDAVGSVVEMSPGEAGWRLRVELPDEVSDFSVARGSLAVDGVSLTISRLTGDVAEMAIIPYTLERTNLGRLEPGVLVNLEADLVGKYVARLIRPHQPDRRSDPGRDNT